MCPEQPVSRRTVGIVVALGEFLTWCTEEDEMSKTYKIGILGLIVLLLVTIAASIDWTATSTCSPMAVIAVGEQDGEAYALVAGGATYQYAWNEEKWVLKENPPRYAKLSSTWLSVEDKENPVFLSIGDGVSTQVGGKFVKICHNS